MQGELTYGLALWVFEYLTDAEGKGLPYEAHEQRRYASLLSGWPCNMMSSRTNGSPLL